MADAHNTVKHWIFVARWRQSEERHDPCRRHTLQHAHGRQSPHRHASACTSVKCRPFDTIFVSTVCGHFIINIKCPSVDHFRMILETWKQMCESIRRKMQRVSEWYIG